MTELDRQLQWGSTVDIPLEVLLGTSANEKSYDVQAVGLHCNVERLGYKSLEMGSAKKARVRTVLR